MSAGRIHVGKTVRLKDGEQIVTYKGKEMTLSEARAEAASIARSKRACEMDYAKGINPVYQYPDVELPCYQTATAVAFDICAAEEAVIPPVRECQCPTLVHTGLNVDFGDNMTFVLLNRSSTPKLGLMVANGIGIFENDYYQNDTNDGEILVSYINFTDEPVTIAEGQRIAQGTFWNIERANNLAVLGVTRRGGFGSTGKS